MLAVTVLAHPRSTSMHSTWDTGREVFHRPWQIPWQAAGGRVDADGRGRPALQQSLPETTTLNPVESKSQKSETAP